MTTKKERPLVRAFQLAEILAAHTFRGLRNGELARALGVSDGTMVGDLKDLEATGWVERVPDLPDRWRLTPKGMRPWHTHAHAMERLKNAVGELDQRHSRIL